MSHNFECLDSSLVLEGISASVKPILLQESIISFNFSMVLKVNNWIECSDSPEFFFNGDDVFGYNKVHRQIVHSLLSYKDIEDALELVLLSMNLSENERRKMLELAMLQLRYIFRTDPLCGGVSCNFKIDLNFNMVEIHNHVDLDYVLDLSEEPDRMVPAAESAIALLTKYEVDFMEVAGESCCICREDLCEHGSGSGSGEEELLSMPCRHVFHGHCIIKWLRTGHCCPLCRFEMPMATT